MARKSDYLLGIAAAVADGTAVDWERAEKEATSDEDKRVLRGLRLVSQIGTVHDSQDEQDRSTADEEGDTPTRTFQASGTAPPVQPLADTPQQWGRYELRAALGAGAQGSVYRAWDPQLECEVALKVLQPRLAASDRVGARMLREGRALAKVRHQNVVNVYAAEVHEGQVGLCMELIEGRTLEEILEAQGPFGEAEAVAVGLKISHALAAVHAAGIVHRDVKARNVMREERGRIVLMDFGTGRDGAQLAKAGAGDLAGTPLYMAPEVLAGAPATQQSDIYSLGVLLYHLVTGQYPVEGNTLDDIIQAHVRGRRRPLAERRPDLPDDFLRIIDKALAPDPDTRYETAAMLVHDLVSLDAEEAGRVLQPRTVTQRVLLGAAWAGLAVVGITLLGFVTSLVFNVTLERVAVAGETPRSWFFWGLRSLIAPVFVLIQVLFVLVVIVGLWRALRRVSSAFDGYARRLAARCLGLARRIQWWSVDSYGLIVCVSASIVLLAVLLSHPVLVSAVTTTVSEMTPEERLALSPEGRPSYFSYRWRLELLIWGATLAAIRLARMRRRERTPAGTALLMALLGIIVTAVGMWAAPWRLVMQSERPRMLYAGQRCYDLGREGAQVLLYCPDQPQARVQRIPAGDPRLVDTGRTETIFATR
jgi:hypothetical protein